MDKLDNLVVSQLLPNSLNKDNFVRILSQAIEIEIKKAYREAEKLSDLSNIDNLPEELLDFLAYQRHVDFYEPTLQIETKRKLVKESSYFHQIKGTPKAVELLIETVFGDGEVEEWFEYGGYPFRFRVRTNNQSATTEKATEFIKAINSVKNKRSILESVIIISTESMDLNFGGIVHIGTKETYRQV